MAKDFLGIFDTLKYLLHGEVLYKVQFFDRTQYSADYSRHKCFMDMGSFEIRRMEKIQIVGILVEV